MHQVDLVLVIGLIIVVLGTLLIVLPVDVRFFYQGLQSGHSLLLRLEFLEGRAGLGTKLLFGKSSDEKHRQKLLEKIKFSISLPELLKEQLRFPRSSIDLLTANSRYRKLLCYLRGFTERSYCRQFHWKTELGFEDYALTGVAVGLMWSGKGAVLGYLSRHMKIDPENVHISVIPHFGKRCMEGSIHCIFKTRLGHIIITFSCFMLWLLQIFWDNKKR